MLTSDESIVQCRRIIANWRAMQDEFRRDALRDIKEGCPFTAKAILCAADALGACADEIASVLPENP